MHIHGIQGINTTIYSFLSSPGPQTTFKETDSKSHKTIYIVKPQIPLSLIPLHLTSHPFDKDIHTGLTCV